MSPLMATDSMSPQPANIKIDAVADQKTVQQREVMTSQKMVKILVAAADESKVLSNMVLLKYRGIELTCIYDVQHNRMRIITPVASRGDITNDQLEKAMEANFHTALDARYAFNKGILYAAFIHPLSPLTKEQLESALKQTATLAATFGKEYSSGSLTFRGVGQPL
jgi:hypothetical protein